MKGERIIGVLRELIGDCAIEDLPVSFTAVATDLESGEEVWLRDGRLFDAIRASIATPLARLKLAAYSPDVTVEIPRNACGFYEFWRAEELIALGRERAAQAFAKTGR